MLFDLLINFCILFTFAVLSYWPFQESARATVPFTKAHPYIVGIMAGFAGFILMEASVQVTDTIIVDARHVIIIIAGMLGGPAAPIISGLIIGLSRMFMADVLNSTHIIAGMSTVLIGLIVGLFSIKFPASFKNAQYYFYYATIQSAAVIAFLMEGPEIDYLQIVYFVLFSGFSFFMVLLILSEMKEHFKKIRHTELLSETDYLTGVYNNRKFQELTHSYITDSTKPFSLIAIDIDNFKKVNEAYGHSGGDEILKQLGERLKRIVNHFGGYVTRNGGEQFVVLLPNSPPAMGIDLGERIRSGVEYPPFHVNDEDDDVFITVSVGVSSYPDNGNTIQELYNSADVAMYQSKAIGRNRVVHYNNHKT